MLARPMLRRLAATAFASAMLVTGTADIAAQEASPTPPMERGIAYPVSIHQGTCEDPVPQPIGPTIDAEVAGYDPEGAMIGTTVEPPVMVAKTDIDAMLEELTDMPHVVAVHASAEMYGTIVACGEIAGYEENGRLVFGLRGTEGSEVSGVAILNDATGPLDKALDAIDKEELLDDGELRLTVFIVPGDAMDDTGA